MTGLCCVWVVEGVWEARAVLGAVLGEIPAAGRGYDGEGAGVAGLDGAGVRELGAGVREEGTGLSGR